MIRGGGIGVTDADGRTTLQLRPGDYSFIAEPAFGSLDLPAHGSVLVEKGLVSQFSDFVLPQGAAVIIEAVDAKTGAGVEGVGFNYETDSTRQRQELRSQTVVIDHPRTDETGRLRAVVEPGPRRFIITACPQGWKPRRNSSDLLDLTAGKETKVRFEFEKKETAKASETASRVTGIFPRAILDEWQRQRTLPRSGKYRIRRSYIRSESIPRADLESFLDATDLSKVPDPIAALQARFPDLPASWETSGEIIESGQRRRNTWFQSRPKVVEIALANGAETVSYASINAQADIFDSGESGHVAVLGVSSFSFWPDYGQMFPSAAKSSSASSYAVPLEGVIPTGSRITADVDSANFKELWVADQKTGFVYVYSSRGKKPRIVEASHRQYGPKAFPNGVILPTVRVDTRGVTGMVGTIELTWFSTVYSRNLL
jgi:hypothetical protein